MNNNQKLFFGIIGGGVFIVVMFFLVVLWVIASGTGGISGNFGGTVAIIPVQGQIGYVESNLVGGSVVKPQTVTKSIEKAEKDSSVSAIVLEINSPGGTPVASEEIMNAVKDSKKPVVVWISEKGTSGAYLAASPADKIYASPTSLVGSIGVIMSLTDLSGLYQKIGVNQYSIKAGNYKDMGASYRDLTPEETKMLQELVDEDYEYFLKMVAENRKLDINYVRQISEGKIYTGNQAKKLKLIDETGDREDAIESAARLGGIKGDYNTVTITPPETLSDVITRYSSDFAYSLGMGIGSFLNYDSMKSSLDYRIS